MVRRNFFAFLWVLVALLFSTAVDARQKYAALVVHGDSGVILHQKNAENERYPASLTKLMTIYLTFEAIKDRELSLNTMLSTSRHAAGQPRMKLGLKKNERISVADAVDSLIVLSANDAAVVLAEAISGSEWQFAQKMTQKAKELGMMHTTFRNASGLFHPKQVTTAKDMAKLMMALERDFPQYYKRLGKVSFNYKGKKYSTHNHVLKNYKGAVAGKTGYVNASGFNLATAAKRSGTKLVAVVMGGKSARSRDREMTSLLTQSFNRVKKNETLVKVPTPVIRPENHAKSATTEDKSTFEVALTSIAKRTNWSINMGAFKREEEAVAAVASAMDIAPEQLASSQITFASRDESRGREHWATFHNLSEAAAKKACQLLGLVNTPCQIVGYQ